MVKHKDPESWSRISKLKLGEQVTALFELPIVSSGIAYHLLSQAGFGAGAMVQHRLTKHIYTLEHTMITLDENRYPVHVTLYGNDESLNGMREPLNIGRLEDFVSMQTGLNILPGDLFELIPNLT